MLDMFEVFDAANPNVVSGKRLNSLRPAQALFMLNSPFVMDQARHAAETFLMSPAYQPHNTSQNVINAWRICLGRIPSDAEMTAALQSIGRQSDSEAAWSRLFHSIFASVDFRYVD